MKLHIFFDESGKNENPSLMGGLSIPNSVYNSPDFTSLTQELRENKLDLHWSKYRGHPLDTGRIKRVFDATLKYHHLLKFNVITCYKPSEYHKASFHRMYYSKLPERILYGLLRGYGKGISLEAEIKIERATEYETIELHKVVKDQLNLQSLYRGEQFHVTDSKLIPKREEIGLELTDLILGMVRTIILNKAKNDTKGTKARNKLAVDLLNDNPTFYSFMSGIKYFEWLSARDLTETNFSDYINMFLANHI